MKCQPSDGGVPANVIGSDVHIYSSTAPKVPALQSKQLLPESAVPLGEISVIEVKFNNIGVVVPSVG